MPPPLLCDQILRSFELWKSDCILFNQRSRKLDISRVGIKNFFMTQTQPLNEQQLDVMAAQLEQVIESKDVQSYLLSNINYEVDFDFDETPNDNSSIPASLLNKGAEADFIFTRFITWWKNSRLVNKVKKAICDVVNQIKLLIDEEAQLKIILGAAMAAVGAALGIAINPLVATIIVGVVAAMILDGVSSVCPV